MSLELAIKENTAAVQALIAVWTKLCAQGEAVVAKATEKAAAGESYGITAGGAPVTTVAPAKAEAPKVEAAPTPVAAAPAQTTEGAAQETAAESPSEVVDLALLTKETTSAATRNRPGLVALLGEFGAARASAIPADKWAEYIAKVRAL